MKCKGHQYTTTSHKCQLEAWIKPEDYNHTPLRSWGSHNSTWALALHLLLHCLQTGYNTNIATRLALLPSWKFPNVTHRVEVMKLGAKFQESVKQVNHNASIALYSLWDVCSANDHSEIRCCSDADPGKKNNPIISCRLHGIHPEANSVPEAFSPYRICGTHWIWWVCWTNMPYIALKLQPGWICRDIPGHWWVITISKYSRKGDND